MNVSDFKIHDLHRSQYQNSSWQGRASNGHYVYIRHTDGQLRVGLGPLLLDAIRAGSKAPHEGAVVFEAVAHELEALTCGPVGQRLSDGRLIRLLAAAGIEATAAAPARRAAGF